MLLGNKEKTIKLHAENFLYGHLTFDHGLDEEERMTFAKSSKHLAEDLVKWLHDDEKNVDTDEHKKATRSLYSNILGWHIRGRLKGIIHDVDLEMENAKLKDENIRLKLQSEEYKKDSITALTELRDARSLLEQYEKSVGLGKK